MSQLWFSVIILISIIRVAVILGLHAMCKIFLLIGSRPPAPLNVCVIRGVFFYQLITRFSMPAAPLGLFRSLMRNSAGFLCPLINEREPSW